MRFLADENVPGDAVDKLLAAGHDIAAVLQPIPVRFDARALPDGTRRPAQADVLWTQS